MYGLISAFGGSLDKIPNGWRPCDGRELSAIAFPDAYDALGTVWGPGSPTGFFTLPNLVGQFLRGTDPDEVVDPDASRRVAPPGGTSDTVGTAQQDALQGHSHDSDAHSSSPSGFQAQGTSTGGQRFGTGALDISGPTTLPGFNTPRIATETRPVNVAVHWIVYVGNPSGIDLADESEARLPVERLANGQELDARGNVV